MCLSVERHHDTTHDHVDAHVVPEHFEELALRWIGAAGGGGRVGVSGCDCWWCFSLSLSNSPDPPHTCRRARCRRCTPIEGRYGPPCSRSERRPRMHSERGRVLLMLVLLHLSSDTIAATTRGATWRRASLTCVCDMQFGVQCFSIGGIARCVGFERAAPTDGGPPSSGERRAASGVERRTVRSPEIKNATRRLVWGQALPPLRVNSIVTQRT